MFLTTCIIIPARSYFVNAFFEFFQNYLYKFPAGSCIRILGRRAVRLELLSHLFRVVPGAGRPPAWTRDQLEELNARNIEHNGKQYTRYEINRERSQQMYGDPETYLYMDPLKKN